MDANSHDALVLRRETATLTFHGPALTLFARPLRSPLLRLMAAGARRP